MVRRSPAPLFAALLIVACGREPTIDSGAAADGRLLLERAGRHTVRLVDAPARAAACLQDTSVVAVVLTGRASAAVAARTLWPLDSTTTFSVQNALGAPGTAAVAVRELHDTIATAVVAVRGTVWLAPGDRLSGRIDAVAEDAAGTELRLSGRLSGIAVRRECGPAAP
jgi:hypothetical protein